MSPPLLAVLTEEPTPEGLDPPPEPALGRGEGRRDPLTLGFRVGRQRHRREELHYLPEPEPRPLQGEKHLVWKEPVPGQERSTVAGAGTRPG